MIDCERQVETRRGVLWLDETSVVARLLCYAEAILMDEVASCDGSVWKTCC